MAIKAGKLIDPEKGTTETNQIILVRGNRIEAVGPHVQIPPDAKIIDLSKSTVLPGLFDAHTHLCISDSQRDRDAKDNYYITSLLDPTPYRAIEGVANARDMLAAGFTTVRDVGNAGNYADTALRLAIDRAPRARPDDGKCGTHHRPVRRTVSLAAGKDANLGRPNMPSRIHTMKCSRPFARIFISERS